ncbi:hypothetical protein ACO02O_09717 [Dirofilaria immitis]
MQDELNTKIVHCSIRISPTDLLCIGQQRLLCLLCFKYLLKLKSIMKYQKYKYEFGNNWVKHSGILFNKENPAQLVVMFGKYYGCNYKFLIAIRDIGESSSIYLPATYE